MSWLGWLLVAFIVLVLLVNFPKQTLVCLGVAVGGAALFMNWLRVSRIGLCYWSGWRNLIQEGESTHCTRGQ
jgi:hypothetical protein